MKPRFYGCVYAAAVTALLGATGAATAQDKTFELKLSHWVPPSHPLQKALEEWGASVEKDSGGIGGMTNDLPLAVAVQECKRAVGCL